MSIEQYERGRYVISTAPERLDAQAIHAYLSASYWAEQIPFEVVERALRGSLSCRSIAGRGWGAG